MEKGCTKSENFWPALYNYAERQRVPDDVESLLTCLYGAHWGSDDFISVLLF